MNQFQHLMVKIVEECSEIQKEALKAIQFGPNSLGSDKTLSNLERIHYELDDLNGVISLLNESHDFNYTPNTERIEEKKKKVMEYLRYSIELGLVEGFEKEPS